MYCRGKPMKKARINLKKNQLPWSFVLYDSVESAFYLKNEHLKANDMSLCKVVVLKPNDIIEAEWIGSEYVYLDESTESFENIDIQCEKYEKVRIGKITPLKKTTEDKGYYVELYVGWLPNGSFQWTSDDTRDDVKITQIKGRVLSRLDFSKLFEGHPDVLDEDVHNPQKLFSETTGSIGLG